MVRRNPKGIASFSTSLISVVAGISGTPSFSRTHSATNPMAGVAHLPSLEERELFFTDVDGPSALLSVVDESSANTATLVDEFTVESLPDVGEVPFVPSSDLNISLSDYLDTTSASEGSLGQVIDDSLDDVEVSAALDETIATDVTDVLEQSIASDEQGIETASPEVAEPAIDLEITAEVLEEIAPNAVEMVEADEPSSTIEDAQSDEMDSVDDVVPSDVTSPVNEELPEEVVPPIGDITDSVVRAVLEQFESQSGAVADPELIRSVTEQVAAQMAAQQTAMRIAQQVLSAQPVSPIVIQQQAQGTPVVVQGVPTQPVAGVEVPMMNVAPVMMPPTVYPVAAPTSMPAPIPGFDPSAYISAPAVAPMPVQYQMPTAPSYQPAPVWVTPTEDQVPMPVPMAPSQPVQYVQAPAAPVQYVQAPAAPVQYVQAPAPTNSPTDSMHMDNMTVYASEATVVYEPTAEEQNKGSALPSIDAFDPSAYLGMNAMPAINEPAAAAEVITEPTWEPVYEFATEVEEDFSLASPEEQDEATRQRESRRAQQMLRELASLRDHNRQ